MDSHINIGASVNINRADDSTDSGTQSQSNASEYTTSKITSPIDAVNYGAIEFENAVKQLLRRKEGFKSTDETMLERFVICIDHNIGSLQFSRDLLKSAIQETGQSTSSGATASNTNITPTMPRKKFRFESPTSHQLRNLDVCVGVFSKGVADRVLDSESSSISALKKFDKCADINIARLNESRKLLKRKIDELKAHTSSSPSTDSNASGCSLSSGTSGGSESSYNPRDPAFVKYVQAAEETKNDPKKMKKFYRHWRDHILTQK